MDSHISIWSDNSFAGLFLSKLKGAIALLPEIMLLTQLLLLINGNTVTTRPDAAFVVLGTFFDRIL